MFVLFKHPQVKVFLGISTLLGLAFIVLQALGVFARFDAALIGGYGVTIRNIFLDSGIILYFSVFPGIWLLRFGNEAGLVLTALSWGVYLIGAMLTQSYQVAFPFTAAGIVTLLSVIRVMGWGASFLEREKADLNRLFGYFLDNEVLKHLLQHPELINQTGQQKPLTILFADIRGFTTASEKLPPETIITMLRTYFRYMIPIIRKHGGTVDKLIGDGIMAFFGDPIPQEDHVERAALAALEMQQAMAALSHEWAKYGMGHVKIGIGLNTDTVVVGNIGSDEFCDYTVLGRGVNLASRLESQCPGGEIHVSQAVYERLRETFMFESRGERSYKNIEQPVPVYRLIVSR
jgi:adenylate cyclase